VRAPVARDARVSEQGGVDLVLTGTGRKRITDTQHDQPTFDARVGRKQRTAEPAAAAEMEEAAKRQDLGLRAPDAAQPIVAPDQTAGNEAAVQVREIRSSPRSTGTPSSTES
jgi:hypothetical protein